jgi:hypothetical protein
VSDQPRVRPVTERIGGARGSARHDAARTVDLDGTDRPDRANDSPSPAHGTPSSSATVAPKSAKLSRVGMGRGTTRSPVTSSSACSRVWSVPLKVGSVPWSLVRMRTSPGPERRAQLGQARVEGGEQPE